MRRGGAWAAATLRAAKKMQGQGLMKALLARSRGCPTWAGPAGSNVCCPDPHDNDMPMSSPSRSCHSEREVPDQPPLLVANPNRPCGERRASTHPWSFIEANPRRWVVGLREGCMLHLDGDRLELIGRADAHLPKGLERARAAGRRPVVPAVIPRRKDCPGGRVWTVRPRLCFGRCGGARSPCPKAAVDQRPRATVCRGRRSASGRAAGVRRGRRARRGAGRPETAAARTGRRGEDAAAEWLRGAGFELLDRNWRSGRYELDIVALRGGELHFAEVKTRRAEGLTPPEQAATPAKQRAMMRAAAAYVRAHPMEVCDFRFDLLAVDAAADGTVVVRFVPDAFEPHW